MLTRSLLQNDPHQLTNLHPTSRSANQLRPTPPLSTPFSTTTTNPSPLLTQFPLHKILSRLDSLLLVLKSCKGRRACTQPWSVLHPSTASPNTNHNTNTNNNADIDRDRDGDSAGVKNLWDALNPKYDRFYGEEQRRVEFSRCEQGYIVEAEGPQDVRAYVERGGVGWSEFV